MTLATARRRTTQFGPVLVDFDGRVLAPREWTLAQSEWAAELSAVLPDGPILELCAGAGHIGLAAAVLAGRDLVQVEADPVAAEYARFNADRAGWAARTEVRDEPMQRALGPDERFGLIIADPPYLPTADVPLWPDDPVAAIDGGPDGLDLLRTCLDLAAAHLQPGGWLLLQVAGVAQAELVENHLDAHGPEHLHPVDVRVVDAARAVMALCRPTAAHAGCG